MDGFWLWMWVVWRIGRWDLEGLYKWVEIGGRDFGWLGRLMVGFFCGGELGRRGGGYVYFEGCRF